MPSAHWYLFPLILFSESKGASTVEREKESLLWKVKRIGGGDIGSQVPIPLFWEQIVNGMHSPTISLRKSPRKWENDQPYNLRGSVERALQAGRGKHPPLLDQSLSRRFQFSLAEQPTWAITYHFGDDHCLFSQTFLSICLKSESCMMKKEETRNIFCHSASNISKISLSL